jgi:hypothetical protein
MIQDRVILITGARGAVGGGRPRVAQSGARLALTARQPQALGRGRRIGPCPMGACWRTRRTCCGDVVQALVAASRRAGVG